MLRMPVTAANGAGRMARIVVALVLGAAVTAGAVSFLIDLATHPGPAPFYWWQDDRVLDELTALNAELTQTADAARLGEIEQRLRQLVAEAPLERRSLYLLTTVERRRGEDALADRLDAISAAMSKRDGAFGSAYINRLIARGDAEGAVQWIGNVIRVFPQVQDVMTMQLANLTAEEAFRPAIMTMMASRPFWRALYLQNLRGLTDDRDGYLMLFDSIERSPGGATDKEYAGHIRALIDWGMADKAQDAWVAYNARRSVPVGYGLFDGRFTREPDNILFGWQSWAVRSVVLSRIEAPEVPGGTAMRLQFFGAGARSVGLGQLLRLKAGPHVLTGRVRTEGLKNPLGLVWRLYCRQPGSPDRGLAVTTPQNGTSAWHDFSLSFDVPPTDCPVQVLALETKGYTTLDMQTSGTISFADMAVTPLSATSPSATAAP